MLRQASAHQAKIDNFSRASLFFWPNQKDSFLPVTPTLTGTTHLSLFFSKRICPSSWILAVPNLSVQKLLYQNFKRQNWSSLPSFYWKKKGNHFYVQEKGKHFFVYFDFRTTYKHNSYNRTPKKCLMLFKINSSQYYNDRHQKGKRKKTAAEENYL